MNISNIILAGDDTAKPATGYFAGRLYFASDTDKVYRDSGSAWVEMLAGGGGGGGGGPDWLKPTLGQDTLPTYSGTVWADSSGGGAQYGYEAVAYNNGVSVGYGALASNACVAIGDHADTWPGFYGYPSSNGVAIGYYTYIRGDNAVSIGAHAQAENSVTAVGYGSGTSSSAGVGSSTFGYSSQSYATGGCAFGAFSEVFGYYGLAFGYDAVAQDYGAAVGYTASANARAVAIGAYCYTYDNQLLMKAGDSAAGGWHGTDANGFSFFTLDKSDSHVENWGGRLLDSQQLLNGSLPYGSWGFRLRASGTTIRLYVNDGGTRKYADLALTNV